MILADKIINLRKKNGLSQEELAEKMHVSRQSVSKWEGAQSVPDLNKIIAMSEIFGVSTDYLLKDSIDEPAIAAQEESGEPLHQVSMEEANAFLSANKRFADKVSAGVSLCILSTIVMLAFGWISDVAEIDYIAGIGAAVMLGIIGIAVRIFFSARSAISDYEYLSEEAIDTVYGVSGMVKERRAKFKPQHNKRIVMGVMLCIFAVILLIVCAVLGEAADRAAEDMFAFIGICGMLAFAAAGVFMMVKSSVMMDGFCKLLEEDDYSRERKQMKKSTVNFVMIFWLVIVAAYFGISFISKKWEWTWVIFAVGGVLTPAVSELQKLRIIQ